MPPRHGGPSPGPSPGPQDAFSPDLIFPTLLAAAVKIQPSFADFNENVLRCTFLNIWATRPPPPADIQATTSILFTAARCLARLAEIENDPFETAVKASPSTSLRGSSPLAGSLALAGAPDITFPHINPTDVPAKASLSVVPPSIKSLLSALLSKDLDDLWALDDESMSLLRDVVNKLFCVLRSMKPSAAGSLPSSHPGSMPVQTAPTSPVVVQPAGSITKPPSPLPRPPHSPTRPPPHVPRPPLARNAMPMPKQSYAKAATSAPATPIVAPPAPKAPMPPSKTAAMRKSCVKQGMKATKVIVRFPDTFKHPPSVNQLWGSLAVFKLSNITITLWGDYILTFLQVLDADDHTTLVKKLKKVYSVDVQVLNRGTTSLLKFPLVLTRHPDGTAVTNEWLHKTISGHPRRQSMEFVQKPRFIIPTGKTIGFTTTVFVEVSNDCAASTAKRLLQTNVAFRSVPRCCKPWSISLAARQCGICLRWGHSTHHCSSKSACYNTRTSTL
ncbi:hypothetical protein AX14_005609 [Amanita brunnescens Koide BX004]|nr:hypothetical protein AX14_005609 [Amanita brunnescens Koide BX004]